MKRLTLKFLFIVFCLGFVAKYSEKTGATSSPSGICGYNCGVIIMSCCEYTEYCYWNLGEMGCTTLCVQDNHDPMCGQINYPYQ